MSISDVRYLYPTSDIQYSTSTRARARARARARSRAKAMRRRLRQNATNVSKIYIGRPIYISDVGYRYGKADIDIGRRIYILDSPIYVLDVRYRFRKYWCHFVLNGAS